MMILFSTLSIFFIEMHFHVVTFYTQCMKQEVEMIWD